MTTRLYPMPKIEFHSSEHGSIAKIFGFFFGDTLNSSEIIVWGNGTKFIINRKLNHTFEQTVTAWVEAFVKEHFPGIVVPDDMSPSMGSEYPDGWHFFREKLLELNPNAIVEEK